MDEQATFWIPDSRTCQACGCVVDDTLRPVHVEFHQSINPALVFDQQAAQDLPVWADGGI